MRKNRYSVILILIVSLLYSGAVISKENGYLILDPDKITRYNEDRIAYQRIENPEDQDKDNSVENLIVIKENKSYFIVDGFDKISDVQLKKIIMDSQNKYIENNDFWMNKINGKPDYVRIIYRRSDLLKNSTEEFVTSNFGTFYKSVRDRFIKLHVNKFRILMKNRGESRLTINKRLLRVKINPSDSTDITQIYFKSASAKSCDETVYYCEDADGDGITETFMATLNDGFDWGVGSGPNILLIKGNTDKDIETLIGKLVNESENGSAEEEKKMFLDLPKEEEIFEMMKQITPMDNFSE